MGNVHLRSGKHRLNYTRMKDEDFMDRSDETLRIAASQYRSLKKNQVDYMRSIKKMGQEGKVAIDEVLSMLKLDASETCTCCSTMFLVSFFYKDTIKLITRTTMLVPPRKRQQSRRWSRLKQLPAK